ncbi:MAG TPA: hypothetical protein PKM41_04905 [Deltaproteobacteria bacterium]|jgi:hypothetical protein|nr:hypothetical protein [Deltaproteobacteria bacterium]HOI05500.1 hypothetical protein [Deltaproteobacteria bacterium]
MQRKNVAIVNPLLAMDRDARTLAVSDRFAAGLRTVCADLREWISPDAVFRMKSLIEQVQIFGAMAILRA